MDGITQETYEKYRINGNLEKVLSGINNLILWKKKLKSKKPYIEIQFLMLGTNEKQIEELKNCFKLPLMHEFDTIKKYKTLCIAKKLNEIDIKFKTAQIYDYQDGNKFIPHNPKYSRYKKVGEKFVLKKKIKNKCWRLWNSIVITTTGEVLSCCFDKDSKYSFGNIQNNSLKNIIRNEKFYKFARQVLTNKKEIDICRNCV